MKNLEIEINDNLSKKNLDIETLLYNKGNKTITFTTPVSSGFIELKLFDSNNNKINYSKDLQELTNTQHKIKPGEKIVGGGGQILSQNFLDELNFNFNNKNLRTIEDFKSIKIIAILNNHNIYSGFLIKVKTINL